jgi:hypothetical protein
MRVALPRGMKKLTGKKLSLSKETLRTLSSDELVSVAGAGWTVTLYPVACALTQECSLTPSVCLGPCPGVPGKTTHPI